jgi:hypothetical protein
MNILSIISDRFFPRLRAMRVSGPADPGPSDDAMTIDPKTIFTPDRALLESFAEEDREAAIRIERRRKRKRGLRKSRHRFYRGIPYSEYLDEWQFHPGRIGGYLTTNINTKGLIRTARNLRRRLIELPNGGLALYYPGTIRAVRLQTNEPIYSGIAQGQLLAGYMRLMRDRIGSADDAAEWRTSAFRVARSMMFPFEKGGVCVDGKIILEAPNYRACPETILNGWVDAMLHFHDYIRIFPNKEMTEFYERNLAAVTELLPSFDDEKARLSRYSNLSPYVFRVRFRGLHHEQTPPHVRVEYAPRKPGYSTLAIPDLWQAEAAERPCIYENKIGAFRLRSMDLSLSVNSLYDLKLYIDADCTHLTFDPGSYSEGSSVPLRTLRSISLLPAEKFNGRYTTFVIRAGEHGLMAGSPTNFMKKKQNFYHTYHLVSLYELALTARSPEQRQVMIDMADRWLDYTHDPAHDHLAGRVSFAPPAAFVSKIASFRVGHSHHSFDDLRMRAKSIW